MPLDIIQAQESAGFSELTSEVHKPIAMQLLETDFCRISENPDEVTECTYTRDDDDAASSSLQDQFQWVDGYKCSICGIEMPLEFIDERQEHYDFHFAERLQEESSVSSSMNHCSKQRYNQKDQIVSQSRKKRRKSLPEQGKFLPIDMFFTKMNQNS